MLDAFIITVLVLVYLAQIWWYERQLATVTAQLHELLDTLEERSDVANEPPFNLVDSLVEDSVFNEAFHLNDRCGATYQGMTCTLAPHDTTRHLDETAGNQWNSATFTDAQIARWQ